MRWISRGRSRGREGEKGEKEGCSHEVRPLLESGDHLGTMVTSMYLKRIGEGVDNDGTQRKETWWVMLTTVRFRNKCEERVDDRASSEQINSSLLLWGTMWLFRGTMFQQKPQGALSCPQSAHSLSFPSRVLLEWNRPSPRSSEPTWPSIYQTLQCHELACVSTLREKPNLSVLDSDLFSFNILTQEKEERETTGTESWWEIRSLCEFWSTSFCHLLANSFRLISSSHWDLTKGSTKKNKAKN